MYTDGVMLSHACQVVIETALGSRVRTDVHRQRRQRLLTACFITVETNLS